MSVQEARSIFAGRTWRNPVSVVWLWALVRLCNRLIAVLLLGGLLMILFGYRLNVSPSIPLGVYRVTPRTSALTYGMLVRLPVPAVVQPWLPRRTPLLKPVAGLPGDTVCITDAGVWVRGKYYGAVETSANGRTLPAVRGCGPVPDGEVFLASKAPRSLDSRYFSAVPLETLTGVATPVWTWSK